MAQQTRMVFDRREKFALLRSARFVLPGKRGATLGRVNELLLQIELCTGADGCRARREVLAAKMKTSYNTAGRIIRLAEALGVLHTEPTSYRGGNGTLLYWVNWNVVATFVPAGVAIEQPGQSSIPVDVPAPPRRGRLQVADRDDGSFVLIRTADKVGRARHQVGRAPAQDGRAIVPGLIPALSSPPTTPAVASESSDGWQEVRLELRKTGLNVVDRAIEAARFRELLPTDVLAIVAEFRQAMQPPPLYISAGAILRKIETGSWPEADPRAVKARNAIASDEKRRQFSADSEARQRQSNADEARLQSLEREFGAILDAMPIHELREIASRIPGASMYLASRGRSYSVLRELLLPIIAQRAEG